MGHRSMPRRTFLQQVGAGGAMAAAASAVGPALAHELLQQGVPTSPATLSQLAEYAGFTLAPGRAERILPQLESLLRPVRAMQPPDFMDLEPAIAFHLGKEQ
jgi:hypothetical protein